MKTLTALHTIKIKLKDGNIQELFQGCKNFNPQTEVFQNRGCPYCRAGINPSTYEVSEDDGYIKLKLLESKR